MNINNEKINFFLHKKKCYVKILDKLTYIIEMYESLLENDYYCFEDEIQRNCYKVKIQDIQQKIDYCNDNLNKCCSHQFVEDVVDLAPETSRHIKYCVVCEYTVEI